MKILIADVLLKDKPHSDWKEGYELCYAFRNLGHECDVFGPHGQRSELEIPFVYHKYDLAIVTENYPAYSGWRWWDWKSINIKKIFWAIDTHLVNYLPWLIDSKFNQIAFNNPDDLTKYNIPDSFWMPYAASRRHHMVTYTTEKKRDVVFIGSLTPERENVCKKFSIECVNAYGQDYVREMQSSKICFNQSISYDINAKYFEIIGSGTFMLTNFNSNFHKFLDYNNEIEKMFYYNENDLGDKINYYLNNDVERENIAKSVKEYIYQNHTWENRAELILSNLK